MNFQEYTSPYIEQVHVYDVVPEDVHIDRPLTNILQTYRPRNFIADEVFPIVTVGKQSDLVPGVQFGDNMRREKTERAPGTLPRYISFTATSLQYRAENYMLGTFATAEEVANDDAWRALDTRAKLVWDCLMIDYEKRVADQVTNTANVGSSWSTASAWNVQSGTGWPLTDALTDLQVAEDLRGYRPNRIVFGKDAWHQFRNSSEVLARLFPHGGGTTGGGAALVSIELAASLLEVDKVLVGGAFMNSAAEGASAALTKVWGDHVLYYHVPDQPSRERPAYGYSFRWVVPGMPNMSVRRFPLDAKRGRHDIHVGYYQDELVVDKYLACLRTNVGSSQ